MKRFSTAALIAIGASFAALSSAQLINQNDTTGANETGQNAYVSQNFGSSFPTYETISVDDFTTSQAYNLTSFSFGVEFFNDAAAVESAVNGFHLEIFSQTGATPPVSLVGDVHSFDFTGLVNGVGNGVTSGAAGYAGDAQGYEITLALSGFQLAAGSYWIGVYADNVYPANGEIGILGSTVATSTALNAYQVNPGGGFAFSGNEALTNPASNLSYTLAGTAAPEPASMALLGLGLVGLVARRRRASK